ncbi:hypothetical protein Tco_1304208 [Tanacetum coccineum]
MFTVIAGHRWVIGHDLRLAVMKCVESSEIRRAFADVVSRGLAKGSEVSDGGSIGEVEGCPDGANHGISTFREDPWAIKEEILLEDAITANVSHVEKKKKCRVVCRTYGVGSAHHARSDGIPVSATTVAPQGLAILLADASTQTEISKGEASLKLLKSMSLPAMYNLDWP